MSRAKTIVYDNVKDFMKKEQRIPRPGEVIMVKDPLHAKDTNPKDQVASNKLPLGVVPDSVIAYASLAWLEGRLKYGGYNWRITGVRGSVYHDALQRHRTKYWNGEWSDPETGVPHLASIIACAGILLEAHLIGNLNDDRPPACPELVALVDNLQDRVRDLKDLFKDLHPHQHTIADNPPGDEPRRVA